MIVALTGLPIGYSVIVALTGLPIGYSVIVALTGLPIGYSVVVALAGLPIGYSVTVALTGLPAGYSCNSSSAIEVQYFESNYSLQATGYGGTVLIDTNLEKIETMKPVKEREITIKFNADTSPRLRWKFKPQQNEIKVWSMMYIYCYAFSIFYLASSW